MQVDPAQAVEAAAATVDAAKAIGAGLATLGMIGAGIGVGNIFGNFLSGALRNPSAAGSQIGNLFVGAALAEALGILAFVLGILIFYG
ncbi:MAG: F-type H+-transporting ATPase subunit c [Brevundimonas sp.]|jgi:F-type H+-transporting ATPase subunit c|uniref:F0F1 ATP synthase subunit C n=1 Tax=Brevundimonas sp. TaxID=1871086 RepID=UPI00248851EC|nr:F0F1 ATP synthase subunit C [Brevundimonas sp.]MDI1279909.1 F0F1 ATP synthase subunit C [Brevundimonas sp.]